MNDAIFEHLRGIVIGQLGSGRDESRFGSDLVPIEQTSDGWYCLTRGGEIVHLDDESMARERVESNRQATAIIGSLARRVPLATWFVPRSGTAHVCTDCNGTGMPSGAPAVAMIPVVCRCGGLGWVTADR